MATGSETTVDNGTEAKTPKPTASNSADQTPNIAWPTTHSGTTSQSLKEAQAIVRKSNNSTQDVSREAVAELRTKVPLSLSRYEFSVEEGRRGTACRGAPVIVEEMHVCAQESSRYAFSAEESRRGTACLSAPFIAADILVKYPPRPNTVEMRAVRKGVCTTRDILRNAVYSRADI